MAGHAQRPTRRFIDLVEQDVKLADVRYEPAKDLVRLRHMIGCGHYDTAIREHLRKNRKNAYLKHFFWKHGPCYVTKGQ